jgi:hypothetical protein
MANPQTNLITAAGNDFLIYEGDTTPADCTFTDLDTDDPIDFSGASIVMEIRKTLDSTLVDTFSTTSTDIVISGTGHNVLTITGFDRLPYLATPTGKDGPYKYDVEVTKSGEVTTYMAGFILVTDDVTEA